MICFYLFVLNYLADEIILIKSAFVFFFLKYLADEIITKTYNKTVSLCRPNRFISQTHIQKRKKFSSIFFIVNKMKLKFSINFVMKYLTRYLQISNVILQAYETFCHLLLSFPNFAFVFSNVLSCVELLFLQELLLRNICHLLQEEAATHDEHFTRECSNAVNISL